MSDTVLEFKSVCYLDDSEHTTAVQNSSFRLSAGDMMMVRSDADTEHAPIVDLGLGLVAPASGTILFEGIDWAEMDGSGCIFKKLVNFAVFFDFYHGADCLVQQL